ncbi:long-chain fatty acid transporter [Acinetobacter nosocomialis]|uniref:outer membrane protein transport protein n=1 Tax=Acinetobacter nosocomialis TaxID=106654 RepID=UPI00057C683A|nr:outer membrane protein transport protein [Acinetobacter nosocomialis]AJB47229.1 long-chain fatty acid transporter [Acinetobacter nosocomialis]MBR7739544.1 outer membrane protein transport protein [Acinetobacter nosocomialis]MBR7751579.1 outer membrane protein transport protein [Acinetobacter nosocomialis]HAV5332717.1 long-chain fatty acid transporter [Acinetobacter baumannii]
MKLKHLSTAMILATLPATGVFAAALDRSGQSMSAFLQPNNYFEAGISVLDPTVEGKEAGVSATRRNISDMGNDYYFPNAALKLQLSDKFSFGLLYDQPFGADAEYSGQNVFVSDPSNTILAPAALDSIRTNTINTTFNNLTADQRVGALLKAQGVDLTSQVGQQQYIATLNAYNNDPTKKAVIDAAVKQGVATQVDAGIKQINGLLGTGNTKVKVDTQNLSFVFGFQPNQNWNIYAGGVYQTVKGNVSLRGQAYSIYNGYDADIKETGGAGWLAGVAYQIPEIALKASLTYRSEIDHDVNIREKIPTLSALSLLGQDATAAAIANSSADTTITTPQSVNFDFQTGIMANTVAFANVRWVNWKDFSIQPYKFGQLSKVVGPLADPSRPNGFNLVEYSDDQWTVNAGVGRKLNEKWAGNVSVGWDSGAGNPVTTLGPTEGYWNVGVGVQYSPTPQTFIAGGVKYFWLGDAKAQTGAQAGSDQYVAEFSDNNAIAYGLKLGYKF